MVLKMKCFLSCPFAVLAFVGVMSFLALAMAMASEVFLGLEPCILCIYQRIPYAVVIVVVALFLAAKRWLSLRLGLALVAVANLVNAAIALYHSGVERHWWASAVEGCSVRFADTDNAQSMLENIMSAPTGNCADIPWQDPLIGLSMANYNVIFCLGLGLICLLSVFLKTKNLEQAHHGDD